jgi:tetratricopeptide (TPR) repeat protein
MWPHAVEAVKALILVNSTNGLTTACADVGEKYMAAAGSGPLGTNFIEMSNSCAEKLAEVDPPRAKALLDRGIARLQAILSDKAAPLSVDDRAEALGYLRDALDTAGKKDDAKRVAEQLRQVVDDGFAKAQTPIAKMAYIWPRAEAYAYLNRPLDLVADYEALAKALPKEYDPPARLGWLYHKAGKLPEAATWTERALGLVYGPRKGRLLAQRAEIAKAAGDKATEKKYRQEAVKLWESLPAGQQSPANLDQAKQALAAIDAPPAGSAGPGSAAAAH